MKDYYRLLGVRPDATREEIRRAYRDQAQQAMWDRPRFTALAEAFEALKDPESRAEYDRQWRAAWGEDATGGMMPAMDTRTDAGYPLPGTGRDLAATRDGGDRTEAVAPTLCPICGTPTALGEEFCPECGFLVGSTPGPETPERLLPRLVDTAGREFILKVGANTVGREDADVMLPDRTVSRRHARVVVEDNGEVWLEDLGSTNGTQRAGHAVPSGQRAALGDGTQLQFGAVQLVLSIPDAPLALPLPQGAASAPPLPREPSAPPGARAEAEEPVAKLVGKGGQVYALEETVTTFGRRPTNHFVLSGDGYVSGAHAQVVFNGQEFCLVDVGSTNGTQLNGRKIPAHTPRPLADGDEIVMGQTPLTFHTRLGDGAEPGAAVADAVSGAPAPEETRT